MFTWSATPTMTLAGSRLWTSTSMEVCIFIYLYFCMAWALRLCGPVSIYAFVQHFLKVVHTSPILHPHLLFQISMHLYGKLDFFMLLKDLPFLNFLLCPLMCCWCFLLLVPPPFYILLPFHSTIHKFLL